VANPRPKPSSDKLREIHSGIVERVVTQAKAWGMQPTEEKASAFVENVMRKTEVDSQAIDNKIALRKSVPEPEPPKQYQRADQVVGVAEIDPATGRAIFRGPRAPAPRPIKEPPFQLWMAWLLSKPEWKARIDAVMFQRKPWWQLMNESMDVVDDSLVKLQDTPQFRSFGIKVKTPRSGPEGWGAAPGAAP
jgi:hypothetical protein